VLGSIVSTRFRSDLTGGAALSGLPADAAHLATSGLQGALAVAESIGSPALTTAARLAFTHGVGEMLLVSAVLTVTSASGALLLPMRRASHEAQSNA
jgi:hypothetical protein